MTGKELLMALVGAGIVGGAAGFAASVSSSPRHDAEPAATSPDVLYRLKTAEDAAARMQTENDDLRKSLNELTERVTSAELKAAKAEAEAPVAGLDAAGGLRPISRGLRIGRHAGVEKADGSAGFGGIDVAGEEGGQLAVEIGKALDGAFREIGASGDLPAELGGLRAGMELRKLPEAERWQKAKDDLGLTWNQVEDLKKAVEQRDADLKEAMTTEKRAGPNGGSITIQRPDASKAAHAEAAYHDRVDAAFNNDEQKKKDWSSKGYDRAFGQRPFGGMGASTMVMSLDVSTDKGEDGKDPKK